MVNDLQESFAKATRYFQIGEQLENQITEQENAIYEIKMKFRREKGSKTKIWAVLFYLGCAAAVFFTLVFAVYLIGGLVESGSSLSAVFITGCFSIFILVIFLLLVVIVSKAKLRKEEKIYNRKYELEVEPILCAEQKKLDEMERQVELFAKENFHLVEFLPMQYRNLQAISFMLVAISNGRADSLKEVFNLYEEQLHRWKLEDAAMETAQTQEYIANAINETNTRLKHIEFMQFMQYLQNNDSSQR